VPPMVAELECLYHGISELTETSRRVSERQRLC
jgi:hypothetical protein